MKCLHHNEFISYLTFSSLYSGGGSNCLTCDATVACFPTILLSVYMFLPRDLSADAAHRDATKRPTAHLSNYNILHMYIEFSTTMDLRAIDARACCWLGRGCAGAQGGLN